MTTGEVTRRWEAIGGNEGGTVSVLAFSPAYAMDKTVFATTLAGVHRSTDGGQQWEQASQGLASPFVDAIAISPEFFYDHTIFLGGREAGVSRSTDGGDTWEALSFWGRTPPSIASIAISPAYADDGHVFAGTDDGIVYRTTNRGRTWDAAGTGLPGSPILGLAVAPHYTKKGLLFVATPDGVFRLDTTGTQWTLLGLGDAVCQAIVLTRTFETDQTMFIGTEDAGIFRSTDGGATWTTLNTGLPDLCVNALALSPTFMMENTLFAATAAGICRSSDGGQSWTVSGDVGPALSIALPPTFTAITPAANEAPLSEMERTILAGTAQRGVFRSTDHGASWVAANTGLAARLLVSLVISPAFADDHTLIVCGLEEGITKSEDGGRSWLSANGGLPSLEVASLAISPAYADDGVVVAATGAGVAISRDRAETWQAIGGPSAAQAIAIAPTFRGIGHLLAGGSDGSLHLSSDGGLTWRVSTTPFAGEEITMVAFSPAYASDGILLAATSRPAAAGQSGRAAVWWTLDAGETWQSALEERNENRWLSLAVPPSFVDDATFFVGLDDRVFRPMRQTREARAGAYRPVWRSARLGGRKTTIVSLTLSPAFAEDKTIFAATNLGVYVSRNGAATWHPLREGLAESSIVAVAVSPTYPDDGLVFAAGLGGTIWRLYDHRRQQ